LAGGDNDMICNNLGNPKALSKEQASNSAGDGYSAIAHASLRLPPGIAILRRKQRPPGRMRERSAG
jgi:hypothetical protein